MEGFSPNYINLEYFFYKFYLLVQDFFDWFKSEKDFTWIYIIFIIVGVLCLFVIVYTLIKIRKDDKKEKEFIKACHEKCEINKVAPKRNEKWEHIKTLSESTNPNDWRVAIIEADTILDEVLKTIGVPGANLGERLQNMDPKGFRELQTAWEAHKVRNRIAHEGTNFEITKRTVDVAIGQFEIVLKSLKYI